MVRWEFKHPTPFLRGREFLWNEGHTMFATREEADAEREQIMGIYRKITEEFLALPGLMGKKTDSEKFAGVLASYSIEHLMPNGKAIQGPDFHSDGQNFAKAFDLAFVDQKGERQLVWQNTWAITTREIGVMIATHGDDKGPVLPPRVAPIQAVIVPIVNEQTRPAVLEVAMKLRDDLSASFSIKVDERDYVTPGRKFNEWELRGVPLRIEVGPRDIAQNQVVLARRDTGAKRPAKIPDIKAEVGKELDDIQRNLLALARERLRVERQERGDLRGAQGAHLVGGRHRPGPMVRRRRVRGEGEAGDGSEGHQHAARPEWDAWALRRMRRGGARHRQLRKVLLSLGG